MSAAIDFAVRNAAGGLQNGTVAGDGASTVIPVHAGDKISLNIAQESIVAYRHVDGDLVIELVDGRKIVLDGWYEQPIGNQALYLSTNGDLQQVYLMDNRDGSLFASYARIDQPLDAKWSPLDGLRHDGMDHLASAVTVTDEPAGMGLFLPGLLGAGGAGAGMGAAAIGATVIGGAVISGGGDGGGSSSGGGGGGTAAPTVNGTGTNTSVTTNTTNPELSVTGTGQPGASVTVTVGGVTQTTTVGQNGTWGVTYPANNLPVDGEHTAQVVVTNPGGGSTNLVGPTFIIDMTPPPVAVTDGTKSTGDIENLADYADGVTLTGTSEPGARVDVTIGGVTHSATVGKDGTWSVTFTQSEVAGGERSETVTVTATDIHGNKTTVTDTLVLDTVPPPLGIGTVASDNIVNGAEAESALAIGGTTQAGAVVTVTIQGVPGSFTATANDRGAWTLNLPPGTFPAGTYDRVITASAIDAAGNSTTVTKTIAIDTQASVSFDSTANHGQLRDGYVNLSESQGSITLTGKAEAGTTAVSLRWDGASVAATVAADGSWTATFPAGSAGSLSRDTTITATATDRAGNTATATLPLKVDLEANATLEAQPVGADNVLSGAERSAGLTLDGTADPGARVFVSFNGTTKEVVANQSGVWSATFATAELPSGEISSGTAGRTITVYAVDVAGNTSATVTHTLDVDTLVRNFTFPTPDLIGASNTSGTDASTLNAAERAAGLPIQGLVEPGSTVTIQIGTWSQTIPASQTANGTWSYTVPASALPEGSNASATISVSARDANGNLSQTLSQTIAIDTSVTNFASSNISLGIGSDRVLNATELNNGMAITGRAEAGSSISVVIGSTTHTATADANGNWTVQFVKSELPSGEVTGVTASVTARDPAGNVAGPHVLTFDVDTTAPDHPWVTQDFGNNNVINGVATETMPGTYTYHSVAATGAATQISTGAEMPVTATVDGKAVPSDFALFDTPVPDGSYLVIRATDAAGNEASTLYIRNTTAEVTVNLSRPGLQGFDIAAVDLSASDANLTITETQLSALTGPDKTLVIRGGVDDLVTMTGARNTQLHQTIDGQSYTIYTLGGQTVLVDDDIQTRGVV